MRGDGVQLWPEAGWRLTVFRTQPFCWYSSRCVSLHLGPAVCVQIYSSLICRYTDCTFPYLLAQHLKKLCGALLSATKVLRGKQIPEMRYPPVNVLSVSAAAFLPFWSPQFSCIIPACSQLLLFNLSSHQHILSSLRPFSTSLINSPCLFLCLPISPLSSLLSCLHPEHLVGFSYDEDFSLLILKPTDGNRIRSKVQPKFYSKFGGHPTNQPPTPPVRVHPTSQPPTTTTSQCVCENSNHRGAKPSASRLLLSDVTRRSLIPVYQIERKILSLNVICRFSLQSCHDSLTEHAP